MASGIENEATKVPSASKAPKAKLLELGAVCSDAAFCPKNRRLPVGYSYARPELSFTTPGSTVLYTCSIERMETPKGGRPLFKVVAEDNEAVAFTGTSPTVAWTQALERIHAANPESKKRKKVDGFTLFGLNVQSVKKAIAEAAPQTAVATPSAKSPAAGSMVTPGSRPRTPSSGHGANPLKSWLSAGTGPKLSVGTATPADSPMAADSPTAAGGPPGPAPATASAASPTTPAVELAAPSGTAAAGDGSAPGEADDDTPMTPGAAPPVAAEQAASLQPKPEDRQPATKPAAKPAASPKPDALVWGPELPPALSHPVLAFVAAYRNARSALEVAAPPASAVLLKTPLHKHLGPFSGFPITLALLNGFREGVERRPAAASKTDAAAVGDTVMALLGQAGGETVGPAPAAQLPAAAQGASADPLAGQEHDRLLARLVFGADAPLSQVAAAVATQLNGSTEQGDKEEGELAPRVTVEQVETAVRRLCRRATWGCASGVGLVAQAVQSAAAEAARREHDAHVPAEPCVCAGNRAERTDVAACWMWEARTNLLGRPKPAALAEGAAASGSATPPAAGAEGVAFALPDDGASKIATDARKLLRPLQGTMKALVSALQVAIEPGTQLSGPPPMDVVKLQLAEYGTAKREIEQKHAKAAEKEAEKARKAAEKEAEKARKAAEKEAEKARKAAEKEAEKARKAAEKEAEKARKAAEKEAAAKAEAAKRAKARAKNTAMFAKMGFFKPKKAVAAATGSGAAAAAKEAVVEEAVAAVKRGTAIQPLAAAAVASGPTPGLVGGGLPRVWRFTPAERAGRQLEGEAALAAAAASEPQALDDVKGSFLALCRVEADKRATRWQKQVAERRAARAEEVAALAEDSEDVAVKALLEPRPPGRPEALAAAEALAAGPDLEEANPFSLRDADAPNEVPRARPFIRADLSGMRLRWFSEDRRPAYWGTFSYASAAPLGNRSLPVEPEEDEDEEMAEASAAATTGSPAPAVGSATAAAGAGAGAGASEAERDYVAESVRLGGRRPFQLDRTLFIYEEDSEEEWEEGADEGEDLAASADEEEAAAAPDALDYADGWLCQDDMVEYEDAQEEEDDNQYVGDAAPQGLKPFPDRREKRFVLGVSLPASPSGTATPPPAPAPLLAGLRVLHVGASARALPTIGSLPAPEEAAFASPEAAFGGQEADAAAIEDGAGSAGDGARGRRAYELTEAALRDLVRLLHGQQVTKEALWEQFSALHTEAPKKPVLDRVTQIAEKCSVRPGQRVWVVEKALVERLCPDEAAALAADMQLAEEEAKQRAAEEEAKKAAKEAARLAREEKRKAIEERKRLREEKRVAKEAAAKQKKQQQLEAVAAAGGKRTSKRTARMAPEAGALVLPVVPATAAVPSTAPAAPTAPALDPVAQEIAAMAASFVLPAAPTPVSVVGGKRTARPSEGAAMAEEGLAAAPEGKRQGKEERD